MKQFRLRTLFIATAVAAGLFVMFLPFRPQISFSGLQAAVTEETFADRYRQFRVTITNVGLLSAWCRESDIPIASDDWFFDASRDETTQINITIFKDECTRIKSGESRTYDILVSRDFDQFYLSLDIRDWRGRTSTIEGKLYSVSE